MAKAVILCAGAFTDLMTPMEKGDCLIAADGGVRHAQRLGLTPDAILGDFDSLGYVPESANTIIHPVEKDDTDTLLAVKKGFEMGYKDFRIFGCIGGRLDLALCSWYR